MPLEFDNVKKGDFDRYGVTAPIFSMVVHRELGKVEVVLVDADMREVRVANGSEYEHHRVHVETLAMSTVDELLGIRTHEDRVLTTLLIGQTVET